MVPFIILLFFIFPIFLVIGTSIAIQKGYITKEEAQKGSKKNIEASFKVWGEIFKGEPLKFDDGGRLIMNRDSEKTSLKDSSNKYSENRYIERKTHSNNTHVIEDRRTETGKVFGNTDDDFITEYRQSYRGPINKGEVVINGKKVKISSYKF